MLNIVLSGQEVNNNNTVHQIVAIPTKIHRTDHFGLGWTKSSRNEEDITGYPMNPVMPSLSATLYITRSFHTGPNNRSPPTMKVVAQVIRTTEKMVKPIADRTTSAKDAHICKKLKMATA
jgi:hypothetical protein